MGKHSNFSYIPEMEGEVSWEYVRDLEDLLNQDQKKLFSNIC